MAQNPPLLQYGSRSPDGRWWWDGQAWQPVPAEQQLTERPVGRVRDIGVCILLAVVTLTIYTYVWVFKTQDEIKRHSGVGVGGGIGLLIFILVHPVTFFLVASDVQAMYQQRGLQAPVSTLTGFWYFLPLIGWIIWFVKVQGALNDYWRTVSGTPAQTG